MQKKQPSELVRLEVKATKLSKLLISSQGRDPKGWPFRAAFDYAARHTIEGPDGELIMEPISKALLLYMDSITELDIPWEDFLNKVDAYVKTNIDPRSSLSTEMFLANESARVLGLLSNTCTDIIERDRLTQNIQLAVSGFGILMAAMKLYNDYENIDAFTMMVFVILLLTAASACCMAIILQATEPQAAPAPRL